MPLAGSTSHSRIASSTSGAPVVYVTLITGAPSMVTFSVTGIFHVAAFGSDIRASIFRHPRYESGFWLIDACVTGSVRTPARLGPADVVAFGPRSVRENTPGCRALHVGAV